MKALQAKDIPWGTVHAWAEHNNQWGIHEQNAEALLKYVTDYLSADPMYKGRQIHKIEYSTLNFDLFIVTFTMGEQANVPAVNQVLNQNQQ